MSQYKRIKELGLKINGPLWEIKTASGSEYGPSYVLADDLERLLENAVKVTGRVDGNFTFNSELNEKDTHTALLLNVQSIERDAVESLLKDIVQSYWATPVEHNKLIERAKKLLGEQK